MNTCKVFSVRCHGGQLQHRGGYVVWQQRNHPAETRFNLTRFGRSNKIEFFSFVLLGVKGRRELLIQFEIWNSLFGQGTFGGPLTSYCGAPDFPQFCCGHAHVEYNSWGLIFCDSFLYAVTMSFFFPPYPDILGSRFPPYIWTCLRNCMSWHFIRPKSTYSLVKVPQVIIIAIIIIIIISISVVILTNRSIIVAGIWGSCYRVWSVILDFKLSPWSVCCMFSSG